MRSAKPLGYPDLKAHRHQPPPKVLSNEPIASGGVRAEFALPGLRRALVHVPERQWTEGSHLRLGKHLAAMMAELEDQKAGHGDTLPE